MTTNYETEKLVKAKCLTVLVLMLGGLGPTLKDIFVAKLLSPSSTWPGYHQGLTVHLQAVY